MTTWSPTRTVSESAERRHRGARRHPVELQQRQIGRRLGGDHAARDTVSPPRNSTVISSMAWTTCAAVMTLPSAEMSTPEPVSVKPIWPPRRHVAALGPDHDDRRRHLLEEVAHRWAVADPRGAADEHRPAPSRDRASGSQRDRSAERRSTMVVSSVLRIDAALLTAS